ncbi:MAG: hypothetical protein ACE5FT_00920 [Candidatus Nanoarchaeia archaeon]
MMAIIEEIFVRTLQIIVVPTIERDILWIIAPLIFGLIMIQMYFGKYKTEQLGWNTAYSNTISLMWVTFLLFKFMDDSYGLQTAWDTPGLHGQMLLVSSVGVLTLALAFFNYQHLLPKWIAFFLSSAVPTSIIAYLTIVVVMGRIPVDNITLISGLILFLIVDVIFRIYRRSISSPYYVQKTLEKQEKKRKREISKVKRKIKEVTGK